MFWIVEFENLESQETQDLMFSLSGSPNGTILSYGLRVLTTENKWILWFEEQVEEKMQSSFHSFSKTEGIYRFYRLDITDSIHAPDWKWDEEYAKEIFDNFI
jgi:hypothetical protein